MTYVKHSVIDTYASLAKKNIRVNKKMYSMRTFRGSSRVLAQNNRVQIMPRR